MPAVEVVLSRASHEESRCHRGVILQHLAADASNVALCLCICIMLSCPAVRPHLRVASLVCSLRTTLCVQYKCEVVACGIIFLAARRLKVIYLRCLIFGLITIPVSCCRGTRQASIRPCTQGSPDRAGPSRSAVCNHHLLHGSDLDPVISLAEGAVSQGMHLLPAASHVHLDIQPCRGPAWATRHLACSCHCLGPSEPAYRVSPSNKW